ncbi:MAG TPA: MBL fold metallo-hydrolase [Tepidisphaeraceae bacterium]|nr:MBL fold metallo-hydrolase [Tepidisphaeraceae bacterium]
MQILMNSGGIAMTNSFVIADENAKVAVMFDAPDHTVGPLLDEVQKKGWDLIGLWLTHGHFDHIADHAIVTKRFPNAKVLIHRLDEPKLQNPNSSVFELPFTIPPRSADAHVEDGQKLNIGNLQVEVIFTPGHAPGHVMYHISSEKILVGGDLIIGGAIGRTDLPDSNHEDLENSVRRVMQLPDDTKLLPGHGSFGTLGHERRTNMYVRTMLRNG